jgi:hypothetical protein
MGMLPVFHAITLVAAARIVASAFHIPYLDHPYARAELCAPFLVVIIWMPWNEKNLELVRQKILSDPPQVVSERRQRVGRFVRTSYVVGVGSLIYLYFSQAISNGT